MFYFGCKVSQSLKLFHLMVIPFTQVSYFQVSKNMTYKIVRLSIPSEEKKKGIFWQAKVRVPNNSPGMRALLAIYRYTALCTDVHKLSTFHVEN